VLINRPPQVVLLAIDRDEDLIEVPLVAEAWPPAAQLLGVGLPELAAPLADALLGHRHPALGQELFDVAVAEGEAEVEPDGVADDLRG
jgi:hypothetical protein